MVYGRGILMIDAARWLARRRLLGVWRDPTQIHLISREDFCAACVGAIANRQASGVYHIGDEGRVTLQEFLSLACRQWGHPGPWLMPLGLIYTAARLCEAYSSLTGSPAPLTRDFIDIGRVSYYGDTERMRRELLPTLKYRTIAEGRVTRRRMKIVGLKRPGTRGGQELHASPRLLPLGKGGRSPFACAQSSK